MVFLGYFSVCVRGCSAVFAEGTVLVVLGESLQVVFRTFLVLGRHVMGLGTSGMVESGALVVECGYSLVVPCRYSMVVPCDYSLVVTSDSFVVPSVSGKVVEVP